MERKLLSLVIYVLEKERRRYACEAHLAEQYILVNPAHRRALAIYRDLERAIEELKHEQEAAS